MDELNDVIWSASYSGNVPGWYWPEVFNLLNSHTNIRGICLDDYPYDNFTSLSNFKKQVEDAASNANREGGVPLYSTFYSHDINKTNVSKYLNLIERPILWTWNSQDLNETVAKTFNAFKNMTAKGRMLGIYSYDFGYKDSGSKPACEHVSPPDCHGRQMPLNIIKKQLSWGLKLLKSKQISGIAFEGIFDFNLPAINYLRQWIKENGDEIV